VASSIPVRFRGRARRDAAAFYLSQLAKGVLSGELPILAGEQETSLVTTEYLLLEIEVKQKKRANHVTMKLRWPRRPLIRAGGTLRATPSAVGDLREGGRDGES
jgi:amphi-Trp domain-containing protein